MSKAMSAVAQSTAKTAAAAQSDLDQLIAREEDAKATLAELESTRESVLADGTSADVKAHRAQVEDVKDIIEQLGARIRRARGELEAAMKREAKQANIDGYRATDAEVEQARAALAEWDKLMSRATNLAARVFEADNRVRAANANLPDGFPPLEFVEVGRPRGFRAIYDRWVAPALRAGSPDFRVDGADAPLHPAE